MFAKALLYRNAPLARLALIVLSLLLALPAVAQQSRALPTAIDNDSPTRTAGTWQWIRAEVDFLEQGQPELLLIPDRDLQLIPENVLSDLIRSEPDLSWLCENPDPRQMRCRAHGPAPFAQQLRFWLPAERLLAADGTRNQALTGHLVTPRPMLMAELVATAESEHPQIELLAPMDLSDDSVSDSLRLLIDGKAASFELRRSAPTYFRPRAWGFNAAADGQTPQPGNWRTEPGFAWNLIPPALRSGQLLELRLHSGLRTDSGPLSNSVNDPEGQLLLRWQAPKSATARVTCGGSARQPEFMDLGAFLGQLPIARDCQANDRLAIFFDTRPSTEAMEALASALPAPLQLDPLGLQLLHSDPASRGTDQVASAALAYRLDLIGAKGGQRYQIRPGANWRDVHGAPIKPEQLRWSTATTGSWDPMIAPERVAFRRQSQSPGGPARSDDNAGQALRIQFGDGESVTQKLPTGVSSANPRVLGLPADRSLWATAIQPRNPSASGYDAPPIAFAVTDLGLHAVILGEQVIAITTDLESGAAVTGAQIELLSAGKALHRGQSDGNGLLSFSLAPENLKRREGLLLTARLGEREAVLGIRLGHQLRLRVRPYPVAQSPSADLLFTDKPAYANGEQIHFRAFHAARQDQRWRWATDSRSSFPYDDPQASLYPVHGFGMTYLDAIESLTVDNFGGMTGQLRIPAQTNSWRLTLNVLGESVALYPWPYIPWSASVEPLPAVLQAGTRLPISVLARTRTGDPVSSRLTTASVGLTDLREGRGQHLDLLSAFFPGYRFLDSWGDKAEKESGCLSPFQVGAARTDLAATDIQGRTKGVLLLPQPQCEFAQVEFDVGSANDFGQPANPGPRLTRVLAHHSHYLGIGGLDRPSVAIGDELSLSAIAVQVADLATPQVPVRLKIVRIDDAGQRAVRSCRLNTGKAKGCRWRPTRAGSYRVSLSAQDYPEASFHLRVGEQIERPPGRMPATLIQQRSEIDNAPLPSLELRQPYMEGRVLLLINDQGWRAAQWFELTGGTQSLAPQLPEGFSGCTHALVLVIPASPLGTPIEPIDHARAEFCLPPAQAPLITISTRADPQMPGRRHLSLRSTHRAPVSVALSVFEDVSVILGPSRLSSGELTRCFFENQQGEAPEPELHTLQGAEVWRDQAENLGRGVPLQMMVSGDFYRRSGCWANRAPARLQPNPTHLEARPPGPLRNLLWQPEISLAPGEVREFAVDLPVDRADWLVELLAVDEAMQVQTQSQSIRLRARQHAQADHGSPH